MKSDKYNRSIELLCPTCGTSNFSQPSEVSGSVEQMTCVSCELEIGREDLINANRESIDENVKEIGSEAVGDLKRELARTFRGSKFLKFK